MHISRKLHTAIWTKQSGVSAHTLLEKVNKFTVEMHKHGHTIFCHKSIAKSTELCYNKDALKKNLGGEMRIIFYVLMTIAVVGSSCAVLLVGAYLPLGANVETGLTIMQNLWTDIINGTFEFTTHPMDIFIYGLVLFLAFNAAIMITMFLVFLLTGFRLSKIDRFYRISAWFLASTIVMTFAYGWKYFNHLQSANTNFAFADISIWAYLPLVAGMLMLIISIIFRVIDKKIHNNNGRQGKRQRRN